jgi:hypothetical protein
MDREVFERAGIPHRDWLPAWERPGTTCRFFRHVLELEDPIEILVKAKAAPSRSTERSLRGQAARLHAGAGGPFRIDRRFGPVLLGGIAR